MEGRTIRLANQMSGDLFRGFLIMIHELKHETSKNLVENTQLRIEFFLRMTG